MTTFATLTEMIADIEATYLCIKGQPMAITEAGERYVAISPDGPRNEGDRVGFASSELVTINALHSAIIAYVESKRQGDSGITVEWRVMPEVDAATIYEIDHLTDGYRPVTVYRGYARLFAGVTP